MAEKKAVETSIVPETVAKADYDKLVAEYQRVAAAYNRLLGIVANDYAEKVSKSIFEEIEKSAK